MHMLINLPNINFPINKNFVSSKLPAIHAYNINEKGHSLIEGLGINYNKWVVGMVTYIIITIDWFSF